jgi:hypothetical protein
MWDRRVKMTNMEVRVGWSMALSNGKGLLNKRGVEGDMDMHPDFIQSHLKLYFFIILIIFLMMQG